MAQCKCGKTCCEDNQLPVDHALLMRTLLTVRVGGLLLTEQEAKYISTRILLEAATDNMRKG